MVNEFLDEKSISTDITESMAYDLSTGDDLEDMTYSDLEIESWIQEPDSIIEEFMLSTPHLKDKNKIGAKLLSKVGRIDHETIERTLGFTSQRCARIDNP